MKSSPIPAPPAASWESSSRESQTVCSGEAPASTASIDAAFLARIFVTIGWFGALCSALVYFASASFFAALSFGAGALLGALLLKSQEIVVRRLLRPKTAPPYNGWDRKIPLWILLPLKYIFVIVAMVYGFRSQTLMPVYFAGGFAIVQFVLTAKIIGRILSGRVRSVRDVYISDSSHV